MGRNEQLVAIVWCNLSRGKSDIHMDLLVYEGERLYHVQTWLACQVTGFQ